MIITCSKCSTSFKIPDSAVGEEGRLVRCSKCKNEWVVTRTVEDKDYQKNTSVKNSTEIPEVEDKMNVQASGPNQSDNLEEPLVDRMKPRHQRGVHRYIAPEVRIPVYERKGFKLSSIMLTLIIIIVSMLLALVSYRWVVVDKFNSIQRIYDLVGMYDNRNLVFEKIDCRENKIQDVKYSPNNNKELAISIAVKNIGKQKQTLNSIRVTLFDEKMVKLFELVLKRNDVISPGKSPYIINQRLERVPNDSTYVSVELGNRIDFMLHNPGVITKIAIKKMKF